MSTFLPTNSRNAFLPTSQVFSQDPSQLLFNLTQNYIDIANAVNIREISQFETVELLNGQQFFTTGTAQTKRFGYRKTFVLPATAAGATTAVAHGIVGATVYTHIYGTCITDVVDNRPIPYASAAAANQQIEINVDAVNINVINGAAGPNITSGLIILEYLRS